MVDESEKKRKERNCRAQQRHRDKTRERARQRDSRVRELEQALKEIRDAVENDNLDLVRLVLTRVPKGPSDCFHRACGSVGHLSVPQPYTLIPTFGLCDTEEKSWMGYPWMMEPPLPIFAPESANAAWSGGQQIVGSYSQQSYLL